MDIDSYCIDLSCLISNNVDTNQKTSNDDNEDIMNNSGISNNTVISNNAVNNNNITTNDSHDSITNNKNNNENDTKTLTYSCNPFYFNTPYKNPVYSVAFPAFSYLKFNKHDWPLQVDAICSQCPYPIKGIPIPLPTFKDQYGEEYYDLIELFCSVQCALRYSQKRNNCNSFLYQCFLLDWYSRNFPEQDLSTLVMAPNLALLKNKIINEKEHNHFITHNIQVTPLLYPYEPRPLVMEFLNNNNNNTINSKNI